MTQLLVNGQPVRELSDAALAQERAERRSRRGHGSPSGSEKQAQSVGTHLSQYYANLELPLGASLQAVQRAYARLAREYHPDQHAKDPKRFRLAQELADELKEAYQALVEHLRKDTP